jgi:hypothetical protein
MNFAACIWSRSNSPDFNNHPLSESWTSELFHNQSSANPPMFNAGRSLARGTLSDTEMFFRVARRVTGVASIVSFSYLRLLKKKEEKREKWESS